MGPCGRGRPACGGRGVHIDELGDVIVVACRLRKNTAQRCGICERRSGRYDTGEGRRRWRSLDAGTTKVFIEADAPRVACRDHGVVVAAVPWARHGAGHTRGFDDQVAWLVTHTSKTAVVELMVVAVLMPTRPANSHPRSRSLRGFTTLKSP